MTIIYANGSAEITVPASSKLAVVSDSPAIIYKRINYPQHPSSWALQDTTVGGEQYLSAAVTVSTVFRVDAGPSDATYEVGTAPNARPDEVVAQGTPTAKTTAATLTVAELLTKLLTGTHSAGATVAYTLPTGTLTDGGVTFAIGDSFDWVLINLSAAALDTITVTAGTDHTIVGNPIVQSAHSSTGGIYGNSAMFRTRKSAANTYVTYRIA